MNGRREWPCTCLPGFPPCEGCRRNDTAEAATWPPGLEPAAMQAEIPALYDVARDACHSLGLPWTDPRTGRTYPPHRCRYCGAESWIDPSDQTPPVDYCHPADHGAPEAEAEE